MKKTNYLINANDAIPLPSNERLEKCVLGTLLDHPHLLNEHYRYLSLPGLFYNEHHEAVWQDIAYKYRNGFVISAEELAAEYKSRSMSELATQTLHLSTYSDRIAFLTQQCLKLNEYAIQRNIIRLSYELNFSCQQPDYDPLEAMGRASEGLNQIYQHLAKFRSKGIKEGVTELKTELDKLIAEPGKLLGITSSLFDVNMMLRGYRNGNFIAVGGSTGEGKTTFECQEALYQLERDIAVGIFSLEMPTAEMLLKLACTKTNLAIERVLAGELYPHEQTMLNKALEWLKESRLQINDKPGLKIGEIKAQARMWVKNNGIAILYIDHLHLVNTDYPQPNPEQRFTEIGNQTKELAKELNIPVVALVQLSRKEKTEKRMHQVTDIKYAGGIEQAADVVLFIFRPVLYGITKTEDGADLSHTAHIYTGKMRLLPGGKFNAQFDGLRFKPESKKELVIGRSLIPVEEANERFNIQDEELPF